MEDPMRKRIISAALVLVLLLGLCAGVAPKAEALHLWITDRSALKGSDYTTSDVMAQKLEEIFDGNISVYYDSKCTNAVSAPIGSYVMKVSTPMYAGPYGGPYINYGSSCWIYANGVYYTLFEDYVLNNRGQTGNSENIDMTTTATRNCTYENFKAWGVRQGVGAQLRTAGHSMIVLGYDETKLITLEGNVSNGLVCVRERSWDQLENKYSYFDFIVQPKESYMQDHYGYCKHENLSNFGTCPDCGFAYNWKRTFNSSAIGCYTVTEACTVRSDVPYSASENVASAFSPGDSVEVRGSVVNAFGETWYQLYLEDGTTAYAPAACLQFESTLSLLVSCTGFKPVDQATLPAASYPLGGTVTSNYPLKKIDAYLDGTWYAAWNASNQNTTKVTLNGTNINYNLTFSKLEVGTHKIKLVATDYVHEGSVTFHESTFYILPSDTGDCTHSYAHIDGTDPTCTESGLLTYQCELCGNTFTEEIPELGHRYENGYCTVCGALDVNHTFVYAELTAAAATGHPGSTVNVPVAIEKNPGFAVFSFSVGYDRSALTFTGASAAPMLQNGTLTTGNDLVNWNATQNTTGDGVLFYLNFQVAENAALGSYPITLGLKSGSAWYFRDQYNNAREINLHGNTVTVEEAPQKMDIAGARMILGNSLEFQFAVPKAAMTDWTGVYALIVKDVAGGSQLSKTVPATDFLTATVNGVPHYVLVYDNLAAKEMADRFYVTIYSADGEAISNVWKDSVRDYVARTFEDQNAQGKTLMADMLFYGAAAQQNFNYNTQDLATAQLTEAQKAFATTQVATLKDSRVSGKNYLGTRLILESRIQMQVAFKDLTSDMYAIYTFTNGSGNTQRIRINGTAFAVSGGITVIELDALVYADARTPVQITVYNADGTVYSTVTDSIESYCSRITKGDDVLIAIMKFADSAKAYLYG